MTAEPEGFRIRSAAGEVTAMGKRVDVSDDPRRILADVLRLALDPPERTVDALLRALRPGGDEFGSPGGDSIVLIEEKEDVPAQFEAQISADVLAAGELWVVSRYTPGRGYDEMVIEGDALRALVKRFAEALDGMDLARKRAKHD